MDVTGAENPGFPSVIQGLPPISPFFSPCDYIQVVITPGLKDS